MSTTQPNMTSDQRDRLRRALGVAALAGLDVEDLLDLADPNALATEAEIAAARSDYECEDVEIDNGALVSRREEDGTGAWVQAWVWITFDNEE